MENKKLFLVYNTHTHFFLSWLKFIYTSVPRIKDNEIQPQKWLSNVEL